MAGITSTKLSDQILSALKDIQRDQVRLSDSPKKEQTEDSKSFSDHLYQHVKDVNTKHQVADRMAIDVSTGKNGNIHDAMLASTQAELSFNLMVQLRNKALEAYNEVMRMPV